MLDEMAGQTIASDLEDTMREPLALTCYLPAAKEIASFGYDEEDGATNFVKERPQRVTVTPVRSNQKRDPERAVITPRPPIISRAYRPARERPTPPRQVAAPMKKVSARSNTIRSLTSERFDLSSLAMFWGVALAGSLVAIGIALTAW